MSTEEQDGTSHKVARLVSFCLTDQPLSTKHPSCPLGPPPAAVQQLVVTMPPLLLNLPLLLLLVVPNQLQARPQDCEIFGDCETGSPEDPDCAIFGECNDEQSANLEECDPIFGDCEEIEAVDEIFGGSNADDEIFGEDPFELEPRGNCFDSLNEIDSLENDGR